MTTLDNQGTISADAAAMRLREATRQFLRALEDYHGLPHSFQTWRERNPENTRGGAQDKPHHVKREKAE